MTKSSTATLQDVKDHAAVLLQSVIEQAADHAVSGADRARGAAGQAKGRFRRSSNAADEVAPTVRDVALQAAAAAIELWQVGRERAGTIADAAEQVVAEPAGQVEKRARDAASTVAQHASEVSDKAAARAKDVSQTVAQRADEVSDKAAVRAKDVSQSVAKHAGDVAEKAKSSSKTIAGHADDVTSRAVDVTKSAAGATVSTTKDTGATIFWTVVASGIVFYALLDEQRRSQLLSMANGAVSQIREIIRDLQGYDDEFA